jgi:protein-S-isoprenylcysteine O-methyltransferase Ste14
MKLLLFTLFSCGLLALSWKSLRVIRSHGFYRFFAFEAILALILLNSSVWFANPLSTLQVASWIVLVLSLVMLGPGVYALLSGGRPSKQREDDTLMSFEKTSVLVTSGIYRHIRHPLYGSLLFLGWGAFLKDVTWYSCALVLAATLALVATARADETECVRYFGPAYKEYMERTKMFVPFLL